MFQSPPTYCYLCPFKLKTVAQKLLTKQNRVLHCVKYAFISPINHVFKILYLANPVSVYSWTDNFEQSIVLKSSLLLADNTTLGDLDPLCTT